jgi:hypothetical protein
MVLKNIFLAVLGGSRYQSKVAPETQPEIRLRPRSIAALLGTTAGPKLGSASESHSSVPRTVDIKEILGFAKDGITQMLHGAGIFTYMTGQFLG